MERHIPPDARKELAHGYTAAISFLDHQVGRVLRALEELPNKVNENTLVVFTADHGFSLGDHGCFGKRTLWDTDTRIPLIVRPPPARTPPSLRGVRHPDRLIELVDLFPTLIDYAGLISSDGTAELGTEPPLEGTSFAPLLRGDAATLPMKEYAYSQFPRCPVRINRKSKPVVFSFTFSHFPTL
jgi:iduronate 2-sulfatase